ncbi:RAM signaling pathway protein-domain-containing protein [Scleroderma citrinum]
MASSGVDRVAGRMSPFLSGKSGALSPLPSISLTEEHVAEAIQQSPDNGITLDFTHKGLTDVGEDGVERLATIGSNESLLQECSITRHASTRHVDAPRYNRLATLPTAFALLSCLRYLNLKNNNFSVFPDVLTVMPSLEILDISRNKIKRLPTQPGSLVNLHVLCISRNKISRLPVYLAECNSLDVLKFDHNPIEWPPKTIVEAGDSSNDPRSAKEWVLSLQKWLKEKGHPPSNVRRPSADSVKSERAVLNHTLEESVPSSSRLDNGSDPTSNPPLFSVNEQVALQHESPKNASTLRFERPPPLQLDQLASYDVPVRSSSPEGYLPTPDESVSSTDDDHTAVPEGFPEKGSCPSSYGGLERRSAILSKQSPSQLRSPKLGKGGGEEQTPVKDSEVTESSRVNKVDFNFPSPLSHRQDSSSSSDGFTGPPKASATTPPSVSPTFVDRLQAVPDTERHAYFKRLSALPANVISDNIPISMLSLLECARSLFFAVSQVYQALSHYITHTLNSQLSSVLRKVTDPAYTYMMQLNGALERFDAMGRKAMPPSCLCRSLVESCRDTAAVFGKAMTMLALQLNILASKDDDRYLRSLILTFYGAVAEISQAWQAMIPHIEAIKSHLVERRRVPGIKNHLGVALGLSATEVPLASTPACTSSSVPIARSRPAQSKALGRSRTTRRHAGSFSSKDVEIGKSLASYDIPPPPVALSSSMPSTALRGPRHPVIPLSVSTSSLAPLLVMANSSNAPSTMPSSSGTSGRNGNVNHSRQDSQASLGGTSARIPPRRPTLEIPQPKTLVDEDALDAMERAVDAAPAVWEMMKEFTTSTSASLDTDHDIDESLAKAKIVTERLRTNLHATRCGDPASDRKALREDAHVFVKTVVKMSNIIKAHGSTHALFPDLRAKVISLTNSTQEFVMLLHVSSFSPSATPRPYSPMTNVLHPSNIDENKLGASLSRSRSAQQPKALKLVAPPVRELPRSALPNQTFNITLPPRHGAGIKDGMLVEG